MVPTGFYEIKYDSGSTGGIQYIKWPTSNSYTWDWADVTTSGSDMKQIARTIKKVQDIYCQKWANSWYTLGDDTTTAYGEWHWSDGVVAAPKTPSERLRQMIQARQGPMIMTRNPLKAPADEREVRARETLLRVIGEDKFRNFLKHGFITVRGKSGKVYQIFTGHGITCVYDRGQMVERLCVILTGNFPPTDELIMRYLMILNNEDDFRAKAIKHSVTQKKVADPVDLRPLPEIYRELRKVA